MPLFRRRKVSCFYCGQHCVPTDAATYHPNGRVSCFICPHCNADNHLDQRGEIIDYVPETPPNPTHFGHRRASSHASRPSALNNLGASSSSPSPTFCTRCEHNQLLLQSARAGYDMPPEDHPDYELHANELYPRYMKDFEARYPPVCADCVPRVKRKLKQVNYNAKVASLGHMLARSERPAGSAAKFGPLVMAKWVVWIARGAIWMWANVMFLVWHLSAVLHPAGSESLEQQGWVQCVRKSLDTSELDATCYDASFHHASVYFPWTLAGFWWLYRQWGVERHPEKKLVGGREYLNIEIAVVLLRSLAWFLLGERGWLHVSEDIRVQLHAGFFFTSFVAFLFSVTCLKLEDPPSFSLRETIPPSPEKSRPPSPQPFGDPISPPERRSMPRQQQQQRQHLSLTKTPPLRPVYPSQPIPPITPSYRDSNSGILFSPSPTPQRRLNEDEMDWDPISPTPLRNTANPWDIRDPTASPTRSTNTPSLNSRATPRLSISSIDSPFGQTPTSIFSARNAVDPVKQAAPPMAEMKFRRIAAPQYHTITGLEGMFDGNLKLDDPDNTFSTSPSSSFIDEREPLTHLLGRLTVLIIAGGSIVAFAPPAFKVLSLPAVVSAALWRMPRAAHTTRLLSAIEILSALVVGSASALGVAEDRVLGNAGIAVVAAAAMAEVWRLLLRMQRQRKRVFWREERGRAMLAKQRTAGDALEGRGGGGGGGGGGGL